jgi:large-conductance mechanosensitive channel
MRIGSFLNTLISFVTIAAAIIFVVVKPAQRLMPKAAESSPAHPRSSC